MIRKSVDQKYGLDRVFIVWEGYHPDKKLSNFILPPHSEPAQTVQTDQIFQTVGIALIRLWILSWSEYLEHRVAARLCGYPALPMKIYLCATPVKY